MTDLLEIEMNHKGGSNCNVFGWAKTVISPPYARKKYLCLRCHHMPWYPPEFKLKETFRFLKSYGDQDDPGFEDVVRAYEDTMESLN